MKIAAGNVHNLALLGNGTVIAWGGSSDVYGSYGQDVVPDGIEKSEGDCSGRGAQSRVATRRHGGGVGL